MAKATTTIRQMLNYRTDVQVYFATNQSLFNQVAAFYFDVIQAHVGVLDLSNKEALTALEKLTHTTELNPHPVMPLCEIERISQPCSDELPSMRLLGRLVRSMLTWTSGTSEKGKRKQKEKSSKSVPPFLHGPGTNQQLFTPACGKSELVPLSRSRSGRARVGAGPKYGSLVERFQKVSSCAALNWCREVVGGTCIPLSKGRSAILSK